MSLRSLITDLKDDVKRTFSGVDTAGSLSNKFWRSKTANNLAKYQQSKIGQSHIKAGQATAKVLFKNPYEFGQQATNDVSDLFGMRNPNYQMRNAPNTGWKNVKTQVVDRVLPTASFIAGTGNPAGIVGMTALGTGINYASNRLLGKQDSKTALANTIPQTIEMLPKSFQMAGISRFTNPVIEKAGLAGKGFLARNLIKAPLNVGEGLIMDKATGMETTKESMLIDALAPAAFELAGMTFKSANDARIKAKYTIDETLGSGARKNGKYASLDQLLGKNGKNGKTQALGLMAGIEPYKDEDGKWRVRFNKTKALVGLGLAVGGTKILNNLDSRSLGGADNAGKNELEDILKAQESIDFRKGGAELNKPIPDMKVALPDQVKGDSLSSSLTPQKGIQIPQQKTPQLEDSKQSFEDIIAQNKKMIGSTVEKPKESIGETFKKVYTQWVDRYEPIVRASKTAKETLKAQGAELRPEYDPEFLVRRLTGAGGIADARYQRELKPIISEMDSLKIDKGDMDLYLANKRIAGFETAGRQVYGADTTKAKEIVNAIETKYGGNINGIAQKLYKYQDDGFNEMVQAGFISPETAKIIKGQNPDYAPLQRVMDDVDNYLGLPTRKTMQGTQPIAKLKGSTKQIDSPLENIIANTFKQRATIEKNRVASSIVGLQKVSPELGFTKVAKSGNDTITVWKNGKKEFWKVGTDIAETAKGLNEENTNTILKIFKAPAALLRQGATGRNPEFLIPNVIRDQLDAGVTSKYGYIPFIDYLSGLKSMLTDDDVYKKWENSGAKIDLGEMSGRKSIQESFDNKVARKNIFSWMKEGLDVMGKYSEQPTRVGLFKKAYNKTGNELMAAMESRDATVDFARMGSRMKTANSIIPFLNVGVQGFDKMIRAFKDNPGKVAFHATVYGVLPAVMTTINNIINHKEEYSEIPQYEKDSNFVIVKGRNENGTVDYITIPKGNIIPTIANPVENFLSYFSGASPLEFKEYATQLFTSTLPVIGDGSTLGEVALKTVGSNLPQLVKPITENLVNKSFYKYDPKIAEAKDIVPYYLKDEEPYKQDYEFTPQMYKKIGAVLNVSPLQVKNLMEGYLAGYAKIPAQVVEMMYKTSNKEVVSPNEKTILRRFLKQTYPSSSKEKVAEEKTKTPFMQRITDDVSASTSSDSQITAVRKAVKESGKQMTTKDKIVYPYGDATRDVKKVISVPKLTSSTELNKKLLSDYKSDLTDYENYLMYQYESGAITEEKAGKELEKIDAIRKWVSNKTKKPSTKKAKKVDLAAISQKILKPVKVQVKSPKFNTFEVLSNYKKTKAPKIEAPNLKVIDFKTAKLKKGIK